MQIRLIINKQERAYFPSITITGDRLRHAIQGRRRNAMSIHANPNRTQAAQLSLAALRVVSGLLFLAHGLVKVAGFPAGAQPGVQPLFSLFGIGGVIEVVAGVLLMAGLLTRPAALIASGQMAVAYWMFHAPASVYPVINGGDAAILFSFIFLYYATAGADRFSLDALIARRQHNDMRALAAAGS
jgi:putative oxidoreductase